MKLFLFILFVSFTKSVVVNENKGSVNQNVENSKLEEKRTEIEKDANQDIAKDNDAKPQLRPESNKSSAKDYNVGFEPIVPPPPPIFALGKMPVQTSYHIIQYPYHHSTPWNLFNYPQINNPYYGHLWPHHPLHGSAYGYMPYGTHPFMFPSMGAFGMNPLSASNPMF